MRSVDHSAKGVSMSLQFEGKEMLIAVPRSGAMSFGTTNLHGEPHYSSSCPLSLVSIDQSWRLFSDCFPHPSRWTTRNEGLEVRPQVCRQSEKVFPAPRLIGAPFASTGACFAIFKL